MKMKSWERNSSKWSISKKKGILTYRQISLEPTYIQYLEVSYLPSNDAEDVFHEPSCCSEGSSCLLASVSQYKSCKLKKDREGK